MAFLDNTGLARLWLNIKAFAEINLVPKTRTINGKSLTNNITLTASDLGLEQAMRFLGTLDDTDDNAIFDGYTNANVVIGGNPVVAKTGDVVLYGGKEFIYSTNGWEELGDEGSHALKSITIIAGNGLTGGGTLEANRAINVGQGDGITVAADKVSHADTSSVSNVTAADRTYVKSLTFDGFGHVTAVSTGTETVVDTGATGVEVTGSGNAVTTANYDPTSRKITLTKGKTFVETCRKINNKALSADITLSAGDVGAYTKAEIDAMEFITINDIDTICNATVVAATDVTF